MGWKSTKNLQASDTYWLHLFSHRDKEMEKSFEVVKHKTRGRDEVSKNQALKLQLDNQYAVLGDQ